jgi:ABC-type phosphate transport system substrate-binding protein
MGITLRRLLPALVFGVLAALMLIAPAANAAAPHCSTTAEKIKGEGSSLQNEAEEKWRPDFNTSKAPSACNGENGAGGKPTVEYKKEASSVGMKKWGFGGATREDANTQFVGTDQPPTEAQTAEMLTNGGTLEATHLETIPVVQEAISVIAHLPEGCTATSTETKVSPTRFFLTNKQLEQVFAGEITKWTEITGASGAGKYKITWKGESCDQTIERVVRGDGSGTTSIFKKYLNSILPTPAEFGGKTWLQSAEEIENTTWPNEAGDPVVRGKGGAGEASTSSGGKLAEWVHAHAGTIGYAGIADARAKKDAGTESERATGNYWVETQYGGTAEKPKLGEPATTPAGAGGEGSYNSPVKSNANCEAEKYTDGTSTSKFPPANTQVSWTQVTTALDQKHYSICGLSYILAYDKYSLFPEFTQAKTETVSDFVKFVLGTGTEEGQGVLAVKSDYLKLPEASKASKSVLAIAQAGAERIGF